jgi:EpsI family protein
MSRADLIRWLPAAILALGSALLLSAKRQAALPLEAPLGASIPSVLEDLPSSDIAISPEEQRIAGMSDYLLRTYGADSVRYRFSVYVGYYDEQVQGRSIHSPKNCLPGAGWEPVSAETRAIAAGGDTHQVNRYLLANGGARAVVYYWYQGRGRVAANEFAVKWELLRDKAMLGRSEEALVRIVIPLRPDLDESAADAMARRVAAELIPGVFGALPKMADPPQVVFQSAAPSPQGAWDQDNNRGVVFLTRSPM